MNNSRRKEIRRVIGKIEEAKESISYICDEEQEYLDNMPESLQYSDRAEAASEAIYSIESALDNLDDAICSLEDAIG